MKRLLISLGPLLETILFEGKAQKDTGFWNYQNADCDVHARDVTRGRVKDAADYWDKLLAAAVSSRLARTKGIVFHTATLVKPGSRGHGTPDRILIPA